MNTMTWRRTISARRRGVGGSDRGEGGDEAMVVGLLVWLLFFFVLIALLSLLVYQLMCLADLEWLIAEATDLALLALSCAELHRRYRPDLRNQIFPKLEKLKEVVDIMRDAAILDQAGPPRHFFCPITREVMNEPCVAADGYTYDPSLLLCAHLNLRQWTRLPTCGGKVYRI